MDSAILQPPGNYPDYWVRIDFDHFATLQRGKDLTHDHFRTGSVPVAGSNGIIGYHDTANVRAPGITVGRSGSVGKVTFYQQDFWAHNTALFVKDFHGNVPAFIAFFLDFLRLGRFRSGASVPTLDRNVFRTLPIVIPPPCEQRKIAAVLGLVQRAIEQLERLIALTTELKKALLHKLFTEGLRGEPQKQTEIGPVPESWEVVQLGACCDVVSGSLSYTDFLKMTSSDTADAVACMGVKVSDMNLPGNESRFVAANLIRRLSADIACRKLVRPNTVVFPKRGAAIATNKKRLTTTWTVLDPNLIGLSAKNSLDAEFLFHWSQTFDLRKITDPGPTPQLNKKDLVPILIPLPKDIDEQREIAAAISSVDSKMTCHQRKYATLSELFRTLLHQLMTAQIRVNDLDLDLDGSMKA